MTKIEWPQAKKRRTGCDPKTSHLLATVAGVGALLSGAPVFADAADSPAATAGDPAGSDSENALQEIVVTAQRKLENLQRAAIAVSVVSSDNLARENVTQAAQLTSLVPALQVGASGSTNIFYLRGVGTFAVNAFSDPAIAFNYDGVYVGRPSATTGVFYDLERIEVVKGPQGTLYGRNATGGAINVIPAKPIMGRDSGDVSVVFGNYGAVTTQGAANVSLSNSAALRVAGIYTKHDGYLSDGVADEDGRGARAQLLFQPTEDFTIRLAGDFYKALGNAGGATLVASRNPATGVITPSPYGRDVGLYDPRIQATFGQQYSFQAGRSLAPLAPYSFNDSTYWGLNADINLSTRLGDLTILPAFRDIDFKSRNDVTSFISDFAEATREKSLEVRFASPDTTQLRYLLGAYYYKESSEIFDAFSQQVLSSFPGGDLETTSVAAFGRLTYAITDALRVTGGVRYTHDKKTVGGSSATMIDVCVAAACPNGLLLPYGTSANDVVSQLGLIGPIPSPTPAFQSIYVSPSAPANVVGFSNVPVVAEQTKSKPTWRVGVDYDLAPESLLYAAYETGYRGGGFNFTTDIFHQQYRPETINAYTIGAKNRFLENRLQLNLEAFYWKYKDQQIAHLGVDSTGAAAFFTENVGDSRNYGSEVEAQYLARPNTLLSANLQYLNAKYTNFSYATTFPPPTRCQVSAPGAGSQASIVDCSGLQALRSPTWTLNFGLQQTIPVGDTRIVLQGGARYQSDTYLGFELLDIERQNAYWTGQASITFSPANEHWSVSAFVNNIGNQRPYSDVLYNSSADLITAGTGAPRVYGLRLTASF